ncbi:MAG: hypothetical protein ACXWE3_00760 [Methylobacter sp.]
MKQIILRAVLYIQYAKKPVMAGMPGKMQPWLLNICDRTWKNSGILTPPCEIAMTSDK